MKKGVFLWMVLLLIPLIITAQITDPLDFISPFNEGVAAVKKGNQWGFIDTTGTIVVDFRTDVLVSKTEHANYPLFKNNRCLIIQKRDDIPYYGYIDKTGKTVIEPQFLNATHFSGNKAIALELVKEELGENEILNKMVYTYKYYEVVIDTKGQIETYLTDGVYIGLTALNLIKAPEITSELIAEHLIATRDNNKKWKLKRLKNN